MVDHGLNETKCVFTPNRAVWSIQTAILVQEGLFHCDSTQVPSSQFVCLPRPGFYEDFVWEGCENFYPDPGILDSMDSR